MRALRSNIVGVASILTGLPKENGFLGMYPKGHKVQAKGSCYAKF